MMISIKINNHYFNLNNTFIYKVKHIYSDTIAKKCLSNEYLKAINVGDYGTEYVGGCSEFKEYGSLAEYIRDIIICLMEAYPSYDEKDSRYLVKIAFEDVRALFEFEEQAYDFAVVYGFSGG